MQTDANMQKLTHTQLSMHAQPFTWLQNRSQRFLRIDMSCRKMKTVQNSRQLKSKLIKLGFTSPNSVQSEIVQKNSEIPKTDNERANKNFQDISKLQIHSSLSSTALCTAFCTFSATADRPCQSLALQPSSQVYQKSHPWQSMIHAPFKQFSWLPIQTCTRGCRSRRIPKPS